MMFGSVAVTALLAQGIALPLAAPAQGQVAAAAPAAGNAAPAVAMPAITFDVLTPIIADRRNESGDPIITVVLKNDAEKEQKPLLSVVAMSRTDASFPVEASVDAAAIARGKPRLFTLTVTRASTSKWEDALPLRGFVVLQTEGNPAAPVMRELRITPAQPSGLAANIVGASLVFAILAVIVGLAKAKRGLFAAIGSASWSDSWGSNITLGSSLLTTVVGLVVFPEFTRYLPKSTYSAFSLAFPGLVGLSPVVFGLFRAPAGQSAGRLTYHGYVFGFALAAVFTLWGALGQLATLVAALFELLATPAFPSSFAIVLLVITAVLTVGMVVYGGKSVMEIVREASAPTAGTQVTADAGQVARDLREGGGAESGPGPVRDWSLL